MKRVVITDNTVEKLEYVEEDDSQYSLVQTVKGFPDIPNQRVIKLNFKELQTLSDLAARSIARAPTTQASVVHIAAEPQPPSEASTAQTEPIQTESNGGVYQDLLDRLLKAKLTKSP